MLLAAPVHAQTMELEIVAARRPDGLGSLSEEPRLRDCGRLEARVGMIRGHGVVRYRMTVEGRPDTATVEVLEAVDISAPGLASAAARLLAGCRFHHPAVHRGMTHQHDSQVRFQRLRGPVCDAAQDFLQASRLKHGNLLSGRMQTIQLAYVMPNRICHVLKGSGELAQLVFRRHADFCVEVTGGQPVRARGEVLERFTNEAMKKHKDRRHARKEDN